jgi:hypothetical protein
MKRAAVTEIAGAQAPRPVFTRGGGGRCTADDPVDLQLESNAHTVAFVSVTNTIGELAERSRLMTRR